MDGVDENPIGRRHTNSASHQGCLCKVSVKYFWLSRTDPAAETVPAVRIEKAVGHVEAEKRNVRRGEILRSLTAASGERDDCYAPIASSHSSSEQHQLSLCSANAVECGNQISDVAHEAASAITRSSA